MVWTASGFSQLTVLPAARSPNLIRSRSLPHSWPELALSFFLMITVLFATNNKRLAPYTAYFVGLLIAIYFTFEAPLSGMSTNPARTLGSAFSANYWHALWIYFTAPPLGMLAAAEIFLRVRGGVGPICAKLHHDNDKRCIFRCNYKALLTPITLKKTM